MAESTRTCRFCGLSVDASEPRAWHASCVDAERSEDAPDDDRAHPMYGPRLVAYYNA